MTRSQVWPRKWVAGLEVTLMRPLIHLSNKYFEHLLCGRLWAEQLEAIQQRTEQSGSCPHGAYSLLEEINTEVTITLMTAQILLGSWLGRKSKDVRNDQNAGILIQFGGQGKLPWRSDKLELLRGELVTRQREGGKDFRPKNIPCKGLSQEGGGLVEKVKESPCGF